MTLATNEREENHRKAFVLMIQELGDRAIDTAFFDLNLPPFEGQLLRTTWEELARQGHVEKLSSSQYRFTAKGWLAGWAGNIGHLGLEVFPGTTWASVGGNETACERA